MTSLLVASAGGHLAELVRLWPRLCRAGADPNALWMTFDTPQSRSVLADERVVFLQSVPPRDFRAVVANVPVVRRTLGSESVDRAFSTGSGVALGVLPLAQATGVTCYYLESAARTSAPSLTGRLIGSLPAIRTYCQHVGWASEKWPYLGSVFDDFVVVPVQPREIRRVVVMLGTLRYPFPRLVEHLRRLLPSDLDVLWQLGATPLPQGISNGHVAISERDLKTACAAADVVIAHAGVGSALLALECGRAPVLVPRLQYFGEHVDNHQRAVADDLAKRGLARTASASRLQWSDLHAAAAIRVAQQPEPSPLSMTL